MKKLIIILLFTACSVNPFKEDFLLNIKGDYSYGSPPKEEFFEIKKNGDFILKGIRYSFVEALSPTNAAYFLDDIQYAGIILNTANNQLREIHSKTIDQDGIDFSTSTHIANKKPEFSPVK